MIFVVMGTQKFQLNRLLVQIDELIEKGIITEPVFAQTGNSDYIPQNYSYEKFLDKEEFEKKISECDILITHSGVGTIISGLKNKKPIIVFPRLAKYKEHVDDHQLEIAQSFSELNYVLLCGEENNLGELIEKSRSHKFGTYTSGRGTVVNTVRDFLDKI